MNATDNNRDIHSILARLVSGSKDNMDSTLEGVILSNIINYSDDAIISTTLDGRITSWNRGAEKLYGYSRSAIIGQNIVILFPKERESEEPAIIERIVSGEYVQHYDTQRVTQDGKVVDVSLTISPLKDFNGRVIGVSRIGRDISVRKKLEHTQARLAAIIDSSEDAIIGKSLDGTISSWNNGAESLFGYKASEVIGKNITILFPKDRFDEEAMILAKIRRGELVRHYESERVKKDGSRVPVSLTISPVRDGNGRIVGASKIARDISDRKKREVEILEKNKELEAYSYSISHDLQAPLRKISHYVYMLQQKEELSPDAVKHLQSISRNVHKMSDLINDLLAFSQVSRENVVKAKVDMQALVQNVIEEMVEPGNENIHFERRNIPSAYGDAKLIRQVLYNLIANALKYSRTKPEQEIEIGGETDDKKATFFVKDNGVGFDVKYSKKLFKAFERLHTTSEFEGTGLGLAIVQQIISKHGGEVWADARVGEGATFYFSLPVE